MSDAQGDPEAKINGEGPKKKTLSVSVGIPQFYQSRVRRPGRED